MVDTTIGVLFSQKPKRLFKNYSYNYFKITIYFVRLPISEQMVYIDNNQIIQLFSLSLSNYSLKKRKKKVDIIDAI